MNSLVKKELKDAVGIMFKTKKISGGEYYPSHPEKYKPASLVLPTQHYSVLILRDSGKATIYTESEEQLEWGNLDEQTR